MGLWHDITAPAFRLAQKPVTELVHKELVISRQIIEGTVDGIRGSQGLEHLPGNNESAEWVLGHLAAVEDWFLARLLGIATELDDSWHQTYWSDYSGPVTSEHSKGMVAVLEAFMHQRGRLIAALEADAGRSLLRAVTPGHFPPAVKNHGAAWGFISTHAYWHIGQLVDLRAMAGLPRYQFAPIHYD